MCCSLARVRDWHSNASSSAHKAVARSTFTASPSTPGSAQGHLRASIAVVLAIFLRSGWHKGSRINMAPSSDSSVPGEASVRTTSHADEFGPAVARRFTALPFARPACQRGSRKLGTTRSAKRLRAGSALVPHMDPAGPAPVNRKALPAEAAPSDPLNPADPSLRGIHLQTHLLRHGSGRPGRAYMHG